MAADEASPVAHPNISGGWFTETAALWPGQAMKIKVEEILYHKPSKYQDVLVFQSKTYGTVLALDGVIQCTERDEFSYQEMITHLPMNSHPDPKRVLAIGGGDGGVLREVTKHESVEEVTLCEIDEDVIAVSKRFLPTLAAGFDHPKVNVHIGDGLSFLENKEGYYDVIIIDSSDPVGPAESLFQMRFFELTSKALRAGGVICAQGECMWLHLSIIKEVVSAQRTLHPVVAYAYTTIPTYPSGQIGFVLCCNDPSRDVRKPLRRCSPEDERRLFRYYNADIHEAAFKLPQFVKAALDD